MIQKITEMQYLVFAVAMLLVAACGSIGLFKDSDNSGPKTESGYDKSGEFVTCNASPAAEQTCDSDTFVDDCEFSGFEVRRCEKCQVLCSGRVERSVPTCFTQSIANELSQPAYAATTSCTIGPHWSEEPQAPVFAFNGIILGLRLSDDKESLIASLRYAGCSARSIGLGIGSCGKSSPWQCTGLLLYTDNYIGPVCQAMIESEAVLSLEGLDKRPATLTIYDSKGSAHKVDINQ